MDGGTVRIQSKFKDYYDHISHRFGSDPNCVYLRGRLNDGQRYGDVTVDACGCEDGLFSRRLKQAKLPDSVQQSLVFLVAAGHVFPLIDTDTFIHGDTVATDHHEHTYEIIGNKDDRIETRTFGDPMIDPPSKDKLENLTRAVGTPVFLVKKVEQRWENKKAGWNVIIDERVPVLSDLGVPSHMPAEQMWQDIYTTLTSVLRKDPDKEVPVTLGNDIRVQKAGFDLKSSFRHPVNQKKVK